VTDAFYHIYEHISSNPALLALLITGFTLFWEDGVVVFIAALVTSGEIHWMAAFIGLSFGIVIGDIALYLMGRFAAGFMARRKWISPERLTRYEKRFNAHIAKTVYLSRFIPGTRTFTFLAVGLLKAPFWRFTLLAFSASVLQSLLVVAFSHFLGETAKGLVTNRWVKIALGAAVVLLVLAVNIVLARRRKKRETSRGDAEARGLQFEKKDEDNTATKLRASASPREKPSPLYECFPLLLFYLPTLLHGLYLALRHRSLRLLANANPAIYASGFAGESKTQIHNLLSASPACREFFAPVLTLPPRPGEPVQTRLDDARAALAAASLPYPFVAKPDMGQRGTGVRRVRDEAALREYLSHYPASEPLVLQQLSAHPREAAVLCHRFPNDPETVHVTSLVVKEFPSVAGDGARTVRQLVEAGPWRRKFKKVFLAKQAAILQTIPAAGEKIPLTFAGNHAQGAVFRDCSDQITPALAARFSTLARSLDGVFYMRFDIRHRDDDALLRGEDFQIIELNGAGGEPAHLYDPRRSWREVNAILRWQYTTLFEIGRQNLALGVNAMPPLRELLRGILRARKTAKSCPPAE